MKGIISKIIFISDDYNYMIITDKNGKEIKMENFISWHWINKDPRLNLQSVSLLKREVEINMETKSIYL